MAASAKFVENTLQTLPWMMTMKLGLQCLVLLRSVESWAAVGQRRAGYIFPMHVRMVLPIR